jgi:DNA-binding transcriptional regulator YhcF (GntR family)
MNETPGIKLTSITINAASPDVIGTLMQEITNKVIEAIPPDTLANIAADVIRNGVVLVKRNSYGSNTQESFGLSEEARAVTVKILTPLIEKVVQAHLDKPETKELIAQLVEIGIAEGLRQAPITAAQVVAKRMAGAYVGESDEVFRNNFNYKTSERVQKLIDTLFQRGIINTPL